MRKPICLSLLLIMACITVAAQTGRDKPRLLARLGPGGEDVLNEIYKLALVVKSDFDLKEDTIALRVCSDDPLPVALSLGKGLPFATTAKLQNLGIPPSRIYYLRQSRGCRVWPDNYALTEYWLVPRGAEFPEFDEAVPASCLSGHQLTNGDSLTKEEWFEVDTLQPVTPQSYEQVLEKVLKRLQQNKSGVTIIRVPYYRLSRTLELKTRLRHTLNYFKVNGIASHRVIVRRINSGSRPPFHSDEPRYPDVFWVSEN